MIFRCSLGFFRTFGFGSFVFLFTFSIGCQQYESKPLDIQSYDQQWIVRDINIKPVIDYAHQLQATENEQAVAFNPNDGLSLWEAKAVALYFNPELRRVRLQAQVPLMSARESGYWNDPELEVEILRILNRGQGDRYKLQRPSIEGMSGTGLEIAPPQIGKVEGDRVEKPWIIGVGLSLTIPLSGRLAVEKEKAWAEYGVAWREIAIQEWHTLKTLNNKWFEWSATKAEINLTREYLQQLEKILETAEKLSASGELKPIDARIFAIEKAFKQTELYELEENEERQRLEILTLLGLEPHTPVELIPDLFAINTTASEEDRRRVLLENHPLLAMAKANYQTAEHDLHLEIRKQYPDLTIGPAYGWETGQSRLGLGFGFPIPLWNRNRQAIAEATAARDVSRNHVELTWERILAELAQAETSLKAARKRRAMLADTVAPLVDLQVEETKRLIALGETDVLLIIDAFKGSLEAKLELVSVRLAEATVASELNSMLRPQWFVKPEDRKEQ